MKKIKVASINHNENDDERLDLFLTEVDGEARILCIDEMGIEDMRDERFPSIAEAFEGIELLYGSDGAQVWGLVWETTLEDITYPAYIEQSAACDGKTSIVRTSWVEENPPIEEDGDRYYKGDHDKRDVEKIDNIKELLTVAGNDKHWARWETRRLLRGEKTNY